MQGHLGWVSPTSRRTTGKQRIGDPTLLPPGVLGQRGNTEVSLGWCERMRMETRFEEFIWLFSNSHLLFWDSRWLGKLSAFLQQYRFLWWIDLKKQSTFRSLTSASGAWMSVARICKPKQNIFSTQTYLGIRMGHRTSTSTNLILLLGTVTCIYTYYNYNTLSPTNIANAGSFFGGVRSIFPDRVAKVPMLVEGGLHQTLPSSRHLQRFQLIQRPCGKILKQTIPSHETRHDLYTLYHNLTWRRSPSFMQHVWKKRLLRTYGFTRTSSGTYIPATRVWYLAKGGCFSIEKSHAFYQVKFNLPEKLVWQIYINHK